MTLAQETEMSPDELDGFLGRQESGVLSLVRDGDPYSIPISYGYDPSSRSFFLRLVSTHDSEKQAWLEESPSASLVVYEESEDGTAYRSVVANGHLDELSPDELSVEDVRQYGTATRPLFEIWDSEKDELEINLYTFEPEELTGRHTSLRTE